MSAAQGGVVVDPQRRQAGKVKSGTRAPGPGIF